MTGTVRTFPFGGDGAKVYNQRDLAVGPSIDEGPLATIAEIQTEARLASS